MGGHSTFSVTLRGDTCYRSQLPRDSASATGLLDRSLSLSLTAHGSQTSTSYAWEGECLLRQQLQSQLSLLLNGELGVYL